MRRSIMRFGLLFWLLSLAAGLIVARPASGLGPQQEGYPPPIEIEEPPVQPTAFPYPPAGADSSGAAPIPIGSQTTEQTVGENPVARAPDSQQDDDHGLLFLWLGFLATTLIFLTSVVGAIILFTRRNET